MGALIVLVFGFIGVWLFAAAARIFGGCIIATVVCLPAGWAWDKVMPALFGLPQATLGQMWILAFLLAMLIPTPSSSSSSSSD